MGKDAKQHNIRKCKQCGNKIYVTAKELVEHEKLCKLAAGVGLIIAGPVIIK